MWNTPDLNLVFDSLGWAVLHSVWQGALAALLVWGFRAVTRDGNADIRYMFGFVTMTGLLAAFIGTFIYYYNIGAAVSETTISIFGLTEPSAVGAGATTNANPIAMLINSTNMIGLIWSGCFAVLAAKYLAAFRLTYKLRTKGLSDLPADCLQKFNQLVEKSGASHKTRAFISEYVSSPITFGFFKPIVLVPAWFFTGMDTEQCEAVLLHELAHIRRHDYIANILQILIKTVFFFHPAVQYISKTVDADREHACDDFAINITRSPENLATALGMIRMKAARDGGVFALAADGRETPLMDRLTRLMGAPVSRTRTGAARGFASTSMLAIACVLVLTLGATQSQAHPESLEADPVESEDTLAGAPESKWGKSSYNYGTHTKDGKTYMVKTNQNGVSYVNVDGNWFNVNARPDLKVRAPKAPVAPLAPHVSTYPAVDAAPHPMPAPSPVLTASHDPYWSGQEDAEKEVQKAVKLAKKMAEEQAALARELAGDQAELARDFAERQADYHRKHAEQQAEHAREMAKYQSEIQAHQHEVERSSKEHAREHAHEKAKLERELAREQGEHAREMAALQRELEQERRAYEREMEQAQRELSREQAALERELAREQAEIERDVKHAYAERVRSDKEMKRAEKERVRADHQAKKYNQMRDRLIPQLIQDGFMNSAKDKVKMKLTETDIFINGQKLPNNQEGEYCDIVSDYIERKGDVKKIVIKPGYLHVEAKGKNGHSSYTFNDNDSDW